MEFIKKLLGLFWLIAGVALALYLPYHSVAEISKGKTEDVVFWSIMVLIFIPISIGFSLFGWYAFKGEYNKA